MRPEIVQKMSAAEREADARALSHRTPIESTRRALDGLWEYTRRSRRNWLYQAIISIVVLSVALGAGLDAVRLAVVILGIALLLAAEIFNTALELLLNWLQPEYDHIARTVKDLSAGAVLTIALGTVCAGLVLFWVPLGLDHETLLLRVVGSGLIALLGGLAWASLLKR
jgi:diacylglycerol kinase